MILKRILSMFSFTASSYDNKDLTQFPLSRDPVVKDINFNDDYARKWLMKSCHITDVERVNTTYQYTVTAAATVSTSSLHRVSFGADMSKVLSLANQMPKERLTQFQRILTLLIEFMDIRYGPFIPYIGASLLSILNEAESYTSLVYMCTSNKHVDTTSIGSSRYVILHVFKELLRKNLPRKLHSKLIEITSLSTACDQLYYDWLIYMFSSCVNTKQEAQYIFLLYASEGLEILYKIGIAIISINEDIIMSCNTDIEFCMMLTSMNKGTFLSLDTILEKTKKIKISMKEIIKISNNYMRNTNEDHISGHYGCSRITRIITPIMNKTSSCLLTGEILEDILYALPLSLHHNDLYQVFTTETHGWNLCTFYKIASLYTGASLLLIRLIDNKNREYIIGAFTDHKWLQGSRKDVNAFLFNSIIDKTDERKRDITLFTSGSTNQSPDGRKCDNVEIDYLSQLTMRGRVRSMSEPEIEDISEPDTENYKCITVNKEEEEGILPLSVESTITRSKMICDSSFLSLKVGKTSMVLFNDLNNVRCSDSLIRDLEANVERVELYTFTNNLTK